MKDITNPYSATPSANATKINDLPIIDLSSDTTPNAADADAATAMPPPIPDNPVAKAAAIKPAARERSDIVVKVSEKHLPHPTTVMSIPQRNTNKFIFNTVLTLPRKLLNKKYSKTGKTITTDSITSAVSIMFLVKSNSPPDHKTIVSNIHATHYTLLKV